MNFFKNILIILLLVSISLTAKAADFTSETPISISISKHDTKSILVKFDIPNGWKVYSHEAGSTGLPLKIQLTNQTNIKDYNITWPQYLTEEEQIGGQSFITKFYAENATIPISITPQHPDGKISFKLEIEFGACNAYCVRETKNFDLTYDAADFSESESTPETSQSSFFYILLLALLGGFVLNLMPCVLPVLSIKLMGIIKYSHLSKKVIVANLLATSAGIIFSFIVLAITTIIIKASGESVGWGLHFQQPIFVMFLIIVLIIFSSNLWGDFEVQLPRVISDRLTSSGHGINNSFLSGAFATLLATPCTISLVSTAVAFAISRGPLEIIIIYVFIGLGMSLPYLLTAMYPNILKLLPKPGNWMDATKRILSILLTFTSFWLLYVLSNQISMRSVLIFIGSLILMRMLLTKEIDFKVKAISFILVTAISFYFPITLNSQIKSNDKVIASAWEEFDEGKLNSYIKSGQTVFVDFTAEWCATCKINKFFVLDNPDLLLELKSKGIILMRADLTSIRSGSNTDKSKSYTDFLQKNKRYGIPFNAVYNANYPTGIALPTLLSKSDIFDALYKSQSLSK